MPTTDPSTREPTTAPSGMDVRRLAAVDMYGAAGSLRRRRIIVTEFVLGATVGPLLGLLVLLSGPSLLMAAFGLWVLTACLNYVPLAIHAVGFLRSPARFGTELEGVDVRAELRHYTVAQVWVFVPLALVVFDLLQRSRRADEREGANRG
jgi:hypothetical protein